MVCCLWGKDISPSSHSHTHSRACSSVIAPTRLVTGLRCETLRRRGVLIQTYSLIQLAAKPQKLAERGKIPRTNIAIEHSVFSNHCLTAMPPLCSVQLHPKNPARGKAGAHFPAPLPQVQAARPSPNPCITPGKVLSLGRFLT